MSVAAGNLDPLFGAQFTTDNEYSLQVQSFTTTGSGVSEAITTLTVTVGTPDLGGTELAGAHANISAFDDSANTVTIIPGSTVDPQSASMFQPQVVLGYQTGSLLLSTLSSFNIAFGLDHGANLNSSLSILSPTALTPGTTITFSAAGVFTGAFNTTCFCTGTMIATPSGEVAVQNLSEGDLVITASGIRRRIVWIGQGRVLTTRGRRTAATPVIVRKSALADNVPNRDLHITKAHSLLIGDALIPVEYLVNHRSILWDDRAQEVAIYHIELETHDVILANGAPAETYRDDGNRWLFHNANGGWSHPPQPPCAPVLTGGPVVDAAWQRFLDRAGGRTQLPLTDDADLHLLVDGQRIAPERASPGSFVFNIPFTAQTVRIVSRAAIPCELGLSRDFRPLGVALSRILIRQGNRFAELELDSPSLKDGFHAYEPNDKLRWTDGDAGLPTSFLNRFSGERTLVMYIGGSTRYLDEGTRREAA